MPAEQLPVAAAGRHFYSLPAGAAAAAASSACSSNRSSLGPLAAVERFAAAAEEALHGQTSPPSCSPSLLRSAAWRAAEHVLPDQAVAAAAAALATLRVQQLLHPGSTLAGGAVAAVQAGALALLGVLLLAAFVRCGLLGLCRLAYILEGSSSSLAVCSASGGAAAAALYATVFAEVLGICTFTAVAAIELAERRLPGKPWALQLLCLGKRDTARLLLRLLAACFVLAAAVLAVGAAITAGSVAGARLLQGSWP
ncbi:hypothetical protein ABPG75_002936 [Micractinium tetrahymenae]